jgi:3-phosphoglycerate kinase
MIAYIEDLKDEEVQGKRVLLRLDLNVPVEGGEVKDAYRMERVIATVDLLRHKGAQTIILAHCEGKDSSTLVPMWHYLNGYFPVDFSPTFFDAPALEKILALKDKGVLLFENVRINDGEKKNDPEFAKKLAQMADLYVDDAFGAMHRAHASIVGVPEFLPHYGGPLLKQEIENISKAFHPEKPFIFILGGAKFDTKLPLIKKYLDRADIVFVGGALANDVFKAQGFEVGTSLVSQGDFGIEELVKNPKFQTFKDVTVKDEAGNISFKKLNEVAKGDYIGDCGPETVEYLKEILSTAKTVVWNGPLGNYEAGFSDKTEQLAEIIADDTEKNGLESIIGGGDTVAAIAKLDLNHKFSFVSTGGGAMLDYLVNETLPGIEALEK